MNADPIKYEVDKESGAIFVDRFMTTAMHYPTNYGYVPQTLSGDGDPVDVLVITPWALVPGVVVPCRPDRHPDDGRRSRRRRQGARRADRQGAAHLQPLEEGRGREPDAPEGHHALLRALQGPRSRASGSRCWAGKASTRPRRKSWTASRTTRSKFQIRKFARRLAACVARRLSFGISPACERAALAELVHVVLDARAFALEEVAPPRRANAGCASQCARAVSTGIRPRAILCSPCAPPSKRCDAVLDAPLRAAGSSRPRNAGRRRVRARPSSGRRRACARGVDARSSDGCAIGLPPRSAMKSSQVLGHASPPCDGRNRGSGRARVVLAVGAGVAAVEEVPVGVADLACRATSGSSRRHRAPCGAPGGSSCACRAAGVARKSSKSARRQPRVASSGTARCWRSIMPASAAGRDVLVGAESTCSDDTLRALRAARPAPAQQQRARSASSRASRRGPGTGVNGTRRAAWGSSRGRGARRRRPRPSRTRTRRTSGP